MTHVNDQLTAAIVAAVVVLASTIAVVAVSPVMAVDGASFQVSDLNAPANATQGKTITVTATIKNTGNTTDNTTVEYRFNGTEQTNTTVELDPDNATNVSFTFDTSGVDTGTYTHGVYTANDSQTATIDITAQPASFDVSGFDAPANVTQGESITVNATITNTGGTADTTTVAYRFNGTEQSNTSVSLDARNSTDVSFAFNSSGVAPDTYTHGVFTADDNQTAQITIEATSSGSDTAPGPKEGPPPADMAAWKNTKPIPGKQATPSSLGGKIRVESTYRSATSVELVKNTSTEYTLNITVTDDATNVTFFLQKEAVESSQNISNVTMYLDGQEHVYYDESAGPGNSPWLLFEIDHFSTRQISFRSTDTQNTTDTANFAVSDLSAPANATQGDEITANATVTNTGNASGQTTVEYRFDGTQRDSTSVSLDAGNATDVAFTFDTSGVAAGTYTHGVFTNDDNQTAGITIEASSANGSDENTSDNGSTISPGPKQGSPPADMAAFTDTASLTAQQTTPDSLSGKIRVEKSVKANTTVELVKNTTSNYTLQITVTGDARNVTFFLQRQAVESSQNISNVTMYLDGQEHVYYDETAGPGNSPWLLFEIDHFSTRTVSFESSTNKTIDEAIAGSDGTIGLTDIQQAIQYWASGEAVPDTGGQTIGLTKIQQLIKTWAAGG